MLDKDLENLAGKACVIEVFAVVGNTDPEKGTGSKIDLTHHRTIEEAQIAVTGLLADNKSVESRAAVKFDNGVVLLLAKSGILGKSTMVMFSDVSEATRALRKKALEKLSLVERHVLGVK